MKTQGKRTVTKLNPLTLCGFRGGLAEWSNASDCKSADGTSPTVQGSNPLPVARSCSAPIDSANYQRCLASGRSPKARLIPTAILDLSPEESNVQSDLSLCRIRCQQHGKDWKDNQRFKCQQAPKRSWSLRRSRLTACACRRDGSQAPARRQQRVECGAHHRDASEAAHHSCGSREGSQRADSNSSRVLDGRHHDGRSIRVVTDPPTIHVALCR